MESSIELSEGNMCEEIFYIDLIEEDGISADMLCNHLGCS